MVRRSASTGRHVLSRVLAAVVGGYAAANAVAVGLAQVLPMSRGDAVMTGILLTYLVYAAAVVLGLRGALGAAGVARHPADPRGVRRPCPAREGGRVMNGGLRQSMAWLHTWTGLPVGWVLFFVFLTGTLGYFDSR